MIFETTSQWAGEQKATILCSIVTNQAIRRGTNALAQTLCYWLQRDDGKQAFACTNVWNVVVYDDSEDTFDLLRAEANSHGFDF